MVPNWNLFGDDLFCSRNALRRIAEELDSEQSVSLAGSARNIVDEESRLFADYTDNPAKGYFDFTPVESGMRFHGV